MTFNHAHRHTAKKLQSLLNTIAESVPYLQALGFPVDECSFILFHLLLLKIPVTLLTSFEENLVML